MGTLDNNLIGVWGSSRDDVWIVGGGDVRLHWDGTGWTREGGTGSILQAYTDITGTSANDVWVSGTRGRVLHYDGSGWMRRGPSTGRDLAAVFLGPGGQAWTVGIAAILHRAP